MRLFLSPEVRIMPRFILVAALAGIGLLLSFTGTKPSNPPAVASDNPAEFAISGPYTHENLSIFLLHGPDTLPPRNVLTLDEALAQGKAIVHETGTVNTLCVENLSDDSDLMMQNGDIVKGGRQDRVLRVAMILPPKSGPVAVESFCVEQGRWTNRGSESAAKFGTNPGQISGKDLKMAVNVGGVEGEVWKNVAVTQTALTVNTGSSVTMNASPTSLQLATENKELQAKLAAYREPLSNILDGKTGVVGYAIAVNGKVTGAEVYGSSVLMAKAWKKAIDSAALEAFAEKKPAEFAICRKDNVRAFLTDAGSGKEEPKEKPEAFDLITPEQFAVFSPDEQRLITELRIRNRRVAEQRAIREERETAFYSTVELDNPVAVQLETSRFRALLADSNTSVGATTISTGSNRQNGETSLNPLLFLAQFGGGNGSVPPALGNPQAVPAVQAPPVQVNRVIGSNGVLVESRDRANPGVIIHRTFIAK
jgi:hypothetical protein